MATLQIRDMPDDVHRTLRIRATAAGQTLSEYALAILRASAEAPTLAEFRERTRHRGPVGDFATSDIVALIRADRDSR